MAEPVAWRDDGVPYSARFDDVYHSESGALAQSRHVFLHGCGLPEGWAGAAQWRILETGFGLGLNFLTSWRAWRDDPRRPGLLHFVSVEAWPVAAGDIRRAAARHPELAALGDALAAQWHGLLPGVHRLAFEGGRVLLTLCVGEVQPMLRALAPFEADSLYLDGFGPRLNPDMWSADTLKAVARFARRGTTIATWTVARAVRDALRPLGFMVDKAPGHPPKRDCLRGVFEPAWTLRRRPAQDTRAQEAWAAPAPGRCAVIGAGLSGAAVAASLARRGWAVTVLDAAAQPASGASGAPAAVLAPHVSPDDALLSRLTRAGARITLQQLRDHLAEGRDWQAGGVLERRAPDHLRMPPGWSADGPNDSWPADPARLADAGLPPDTPALWHAEGAWVRPAALVAAWLAGPGIRLRTGARVDRLQRANEAWQLLDAEGRLLAETDRVVIAAGHASRAFAPSMPLQPVRGQLAWGPMDGPADGHTLPRAPMNGDGHLIAHVPLPTGDGRFWLSGATFEPGDPGTDLRAEGQAANLERLARLHPAVARLLAPRFAAGQARAWAGVRCASGDRRPLLGPVAPEDASLWLLSALGSRGLSFAALCAELLAARWHAEPLLLTARMALSLDTRRL